MAPHAAAVTAEVHTLDSSSLEQDTENGNGSHQPAPLPAHSHDTQGVKCDTQPAPSPAQLQGIVNNLRGFKGEMECIQVCEDDGNYVNCCFERKEQGVMECIQVCVRTGDCCSSQ